MTHKWNIFIHFSKFCQFHSSKVFPPYLFYPKGQSNAKQSDRNVNRVWLCFSLKTYPLSSKYLLKEILNPPHFPQNAISKSIPPKKEQKIPRNIVCYSKKWRVQNSLKIKPKMDGSEWKMIYISLWKQIQYFGKSQSGRSIIFSFVHTRLTSCSLMFAPFRTRISTISFLLFLAAVLKGV